MPAGFVHPLGQALGNRGIVHLVDQRGVDPFELGIVEAGGGAAEGGEIEAFEQHRAVRNRFDRQRSAQPRQQRNDRLRFEPALAKRIAAERAEPLRKLALRADQQRLMREPRHLPRTVLYRDQRGKHLDLHCGIADMILAAQHLRDTHVEIVDRAGQHVEPAAIGTADDRIGQLRGVEFLRAAHAIVPGNRRSVIELETPVRGDARGLLGGTLGCAQFERPAIVDRRQPASETDLALELELLLRLVAGIDPLRLAQRRKGAFVQREPLRLAGLAIGLETQPCEIGADRLDIVLAAALGIGIVDTQQETPAALLGEHPVVQRSADIADMEPPGGRRGEAGDIGHARADSRGARAWREVSWLATSAA